MARASEATPDRGFLARLMALCSLPRSNPGNQIRYVRRNGPYTLVMTTAGINKLPHGSNPRLILAWVCTEAVRTGSRDIVLGRSLSEFMRKLGIWYCQVITSPQSGELGGCEPPQGRPISTR